MSPPVCFLRNTPAEFIAPRDLVNEVSALRTEYCVQYQFQIMTGSGIAMQIKGSRFLQNSMNFCYTKRYANQVRKQRSFSENSVKSLYQGYQLRAKTPFVVCENLIKPRDRQVIPGPGIRKCLGLSAVLVSDIVIYLVVISLRIEWWINVAQINRLVFDLLPKDIQVIAVVQTAHNGILYFNSLLSRGWRLVHRAAILMPKPFSLVRACAASGVCG